MRLDQLIQAQGYTSKKAVGRILNRQLVQIEGKTVFDGSIDVDPGYEQIRIANQLICDASHRYILLNKPRGVLSAASDLKHQTVIDLIQTQDKIKNLVPVGRLDRDTSGLILLTNNGYFLHRIIAPEHQIEKEYLVKVNGLLTSEAQKCFKEGIIFPDGTICQPTELKILEEYSDYSMASIILKEGKFHQIKKMFLNVGLKVIALKRVRIEFLEISSLPKEGTYRLLTKAEWQEFYDIFRLESHQELH